MSINVRFDKRGWYHPAFGRLGRGHHTDRIYVLPDMFGETETVKVPVMDQSSKPPRKTGEKEVTRYKHLPSSAEVLDENGIRLLAEEAEANNEEPPKPVRPKVADKDALDAVTSRAKSDSNTGRRSAARQKATT